MNYNEYYEKRIVYNGKLTENEKETIEKILKSLEEKKITEDKKKEYIDKLEELLVLLDRDTSLISNVMRTNYNFDLAFNNLLLEIENIKEEERIFKVKPKKIEKKKNVKNLKVKVKKELDTEKKQDKEEEPGQDEKKEEPKVEEKILSRDELLLLIVNQITNFDRACSEIVKMTDETLEKIQNTAVGKEFLMLKNDFGKIDGKFASSFGNNGEKVNELVTRMKEFLSNEPGTEFALNIREINYKLDLVKEKIKDTKLKYVDRYNLIVEKYNQKLDVLNKSEKDIKDSELKSLKKMDTCTIEKNFAYSNKLRTVNNIGLVENLQKIDNNSKIEQLVTVDNGDLDNKVNQLDSVIDSFSIQIQKVGRIIKDKETRSKIDKIFDECYGKLGELKTEVYTSREDGEDKYSRRTAKIKELYDKLDDISILYRSKCPLLVKKVKSAKDLYKKHEKTPLIASGLSALSMVDFVVGPIIIPAIMCGNLMLAKKNPMIKNTTDALARVIDAKECEDGYKLHTGLLLNEKTASLSMLKSIAVCEVREWIAPLVNEAKRLFQKMKNKRHKKDIVNELDKHKEEAINETREEKHKKGRR